MSRQVYLPLARPASTDGPRCGVLKRCRHLFIESEGLALCCAFGEQLRVTTGRRSGTRMFERCETCRTAERLFGSPGVPEPATAAELLDHEAAEESAWAEFDALPIGVVRQVVEEWLAERKGARHPEVTDEWADGMLSARNPEVES